MKKKPDKIEEKLRKRFNLAEELVGRDIFRAEDSILVRNPGIKSAIIENFCGKTP